MYETLIDRGIIGIFGTDAVKFLHNLITNDIKKYDYCYNYALNSQSRYLFDFFVFKSSETDLLIDINLNQADLLITYLMKYKLRAKIEIANLSDKYQIIYSKEKLEDNSIILSIQDPRYHKLGFRSIINKELKNCSNIPTTEIPGLYLQDKYNMAIVDGYEDLIYEKSIPIEYGGEELNAISYTKGCYTGQEIIARTKYQGVVRKAIFKLSAQANISNMLKNEEIIIDNKKIGISCSTHQNMGIALIRLENYIQLKDNMITLKNIPISLSVPSWRE